MSDDLAVTNLEDAGDRQVEGLSLPAEAVNTLGKHEVAIRSDREHLNVDRIHQIGEAQECSADRLRTPHGRNGNVVVHRIGVEEVRATRLRPDWKTGLRAKSAARKLASRPKI